MKSYGFIGNLINLDDCNAYEFENGYVLKKASDTQVVEIKEKLPISDDIKFIKRYELIDFNEVQKELWNYWIIEHSNMQIDHDFNIALKLSKSNLHIIMERLQIGWLGIQSPHMYNFISENQMNFKVNVLKSSELDDVYGLYINLKQIKERSEYKSITRAIDDFDNLELIPIYTNFKIIALFSIMENLITKNPERGIDISISKQLSNKLNLLNNRFEKKIVYNDFFNGSNDVKLTTLIEKLYAYRSDIAHGNYLDFENRLQMLNNKEKVYTFLYNLVKKVIKQSLREPDLVVDLKEC